MLAQVGQSGGVGNFVNTAGGNLFFTGLEKTNAYPPRAAGPDNTTIFWDSRVWPGAGATTVGNAIYISPATMDHLRNSSAAEAKALIAHEYTHVLQYRAEGISYLPDYNSAAGAAAGAGHDRGSPFNSYELPAYTIQYIYEQNPWLPGPWSFPVVR